MKRKPSMSHRHTAKYIAGIFVVLFIIFVIPFTVHQTQKKTISGVNATASTKLSFSAASLQTGINGTISSDIMLDPGNNMVSFVYLTIDYDSSKVTPAANGLVRNTSSFPDILEGPLYNQCSGIQCKMSIALSVGSNPANAITQATKVATVNFNAVALTDTTGTQLTFDNKTEVLSIAPADTSSENVLSTSIPLSIVITNNNLSGTPNPSITTFATPTLCPGCPTPTINPSLTPGQSITPPGNQTATPEPSDITFGLKLIFPGIGVNGGTQHPKNPARKIHITFYSLDTGSRYDFDDHLVFDGKYFSKPVIDVGTIPLGSYQIYVRSPFYLTTRLTAADGSNTFIVNNDPNMPFTVPINSLVAGDIAPNTSLSNYGDDVLDLFDYAIVIGCYKKKATTKFCVNKTAADINDDGIVDGVDYNLWLKNIAVTTVGDSIPVFPALK